jgi:hypothetical protein
VVLAVAGIGGWWWQNRVAHPDVHYHAGFQVYINGVKQDYSGIEFMHIKPCMTEGESKHDLSDPIERAHLHDDVGDVVHIHDDGVVWKMLYDYLKIGSPVRIGYINGKEFPGFLAGKIEPYDSLIGFIGEKPANWQELVDQRVTRERIVEVEGKSENCGS